jgi:hypothetical protein
MLSVLCAFPGVSIAARIAMNVEGDAVFIKSSDENYKSVRKRLDFCWMLGG